MALGAMTLQNDPLMSKARAVQPFTSRPAWRQPQERRNQAAAGAAAAVSTATVNALAAGVTCPPLSCPPASPPRLRRLHGSRLLQEEHTLPWLDV